MAGSIHKHTAKDGTVSWRVRVDAQDPQTGKRHQPQRTFPTKRDAERGLREWLSQIEAQGGGAFGSSTQTTQQYLDWWLRDCASSRLKPTSLSSYRWMLARYALPTLGRLPLAKLSAQHLQSLYAELSRQSLSGRTICLLHSILHGALAEAVRLGLLARNPADQARAPRPQRKEAAAWSPQELARFLGVARSDSYWPLWLLAAHTGLRRSELLAACAGATWTWMAPRRPCRCARAWYAPGTTFGVQQGAKRGGKRLFRGPADAPGAPGRRACRLSWGPGRAGTRVGGLRRRLADHRARTTPRCTLTVAGSGRRNERERVRLEHAALTVYVRRKRVRLLRRYPYGCGLWRTMDGVLGDRWRLYLCPWPGRGLVLEWGDLSPLNF